MRSRTRRALLAALPGLSLAWLARAAAPVAGSEAQRGRFETHEAFPSRHVAARTVRVWLPPDHDEGDPCDVLYMQDGQNLFAPANPWGHGPWDVDGHLLALRAQGAIRKAMVVGIDSAGLDRSREYAPQAALERLAPEARRHGLGPEGAPLLGDAYLRFLVEELKPFVDRRYRTRPGRAHTHAVGSSMGGLISLYALARYPKVFGTAAGLSTHWPIALGPGMLEPEPSAETLAMADAFLAWVGESLPHAGRHRLYFDHGDQTLDALYGPFQARMDEIALGKGYRPGRDYRSERFPGSPHDEAAWRARLAIPLSFLLAKTSS